VSGHSFLLLFSFLTSRIANLCSHVIQAARNPVNLDDRQVDAVAARIELDLRIGYAFTRHLTNTLRCLGGAMADDNGKRRVISYGEYTPVPPPVPLPPLTSGLGSCQFPTLGFVVDRYFRVKNFTPEVFWSIKVKHRRDNIDVNFTWKRNRLFDRAVVTILFERCILAKIAKITKVQEKPTSKWKPLPLTTVELQKNATRFLRMNSAEAMTVAEGLYQKGFISYPRTETDQFDAGMDLRALVQKQTPSGQWGAYAQQLLGGGFHAPRAGRHDDKAHPPIHPVAWVEPQKLNDAERRIYEFVVRRFLACCSDDAKGQATTVEMAYGEEESFSAHGVVVLARNYLDVYPYDKWSSSTTLPAFTLGERFEPTEALMVEGATTAPGYLTEPDLIALMDANGIGTDATMATHIKMIKDRNYVFTQPKGGGGGGGSRAEAASRGGGRGRGRGRGSGRGRGGGGETAAAGGRGNGNGSGNGSGSGSGSGMEEFIPSTLGVALVDGHDQMGFETSLSKPFLRKEMELRMKDICAGRLTGATVLRDSLRQYRQVFVQSQERVDILKSVSYFLILDYS
jgi:DNA topoisomerase-3